VGINNMQTPLWVVISSYIIFISIIIYQEIRIKALSFYFWNLDKILKIYIHKYGKLEEEDLEEK